MSDTFDKRLIDALGETGDCPPLDRLLDLLDGKQGEETRARAEAHAGACVHCTTELALFREFENPTPRPEEKADVAAIVSRLRRNSPVVSAPWWKKWTAMKWVAPLAVAMAALILGLLLRNAPEDRTPRVDDGAMRSGNIPVISPVGFISVRPDKLQWQTVQGAVKYRVNLSEVDETPVWSTILATPEAGLPADVLAKITPHKTLIWKISALDDHGAVIAESGKVGFQFVPGHQ